MAQAITIAGATYSAVPSIECPKQGGGTASFTDVTDTTAAASDVASDKYFYTAAGVRTAGSMASGSATPAASISATGATVTTGTNKITLSKTVSNTPQVTAGYISAGTSGNTDVSLQATVTTRAAATIHPSTSNQTISSGQYLTGNQTFAAVTTENLTASNIVSGVVVKVGDADDPTRIAQVTGTASGGGATIATKTATVGSSNATTLSFTSLAAKPKMFAAQISYNSGSYLTLGSTRYITSMMSDGTNTYSTTGYRSNQNGREYVYTTCTWSYSSGTLTLTSAGSSTTGYFKSSATYRLIYAY